MANETTELTMAEIREANARCEALSKQGYKVNGVVGPEIDRRKRYDIARWLSTEEGRRDLRALHDAQDSPTRSIRELDKIQRDLDNRRPFDDYDPLAARSSTDRYLWGRDDDIRSGKRTR